MTCQSSSCRIYDWDEPISSSGRKWNEPLLIERMTKDWKRKTSISLVDLFFHFLFPNSNHIPVQQKELLEFLPPTYAAARFEPTTVEFAPDWDLLRILYRLSYGAAANNWPFKIKHRYLSNNQTSSLQNWIRFTFAKRRIKRASLSCIDKRCY